ncbi:uncharacterized protein LOC121735182 [Aricia agestis]|uniref:uncharacterized protein LOC121735182 n=1 Tax=Aricia agestis TaxID=91739 RepID=UPI001C20561F|nr:uncharacterized protein LOC121735182 [Aricia agestis]
MARAVVFTLTALLALFEFGSCLQCYQCNSQSDPNCRDPFSSSRALVDCNTQDTINYNRQYLSQILPRELLDSVAGAPRYCTKLVMKNGSTVRTCLDANPTDLSHTCKMLTNIAQVTDPSRMIEHCSVCDKDRCNGAASIAASLPLLFAAIAAYLYSKQ